MAKTQCYFCDETPAEYVCDSCGKHLCRRHTHSKGWFSSKDYCKECK